MVIEQGDLFWLDFEQPRGSEPGGLRPTLILQANEFNRSKINTVIVAAITSNLKYEMMPGNVRLLKGEGGIPKSSVINISQIKTVDHSYLRDKIGKISNHKFELVKEGIRRIFGV